MRHTGNTVEVFRARWLGQGSVLVHASARTYAATAEWRLVEREIIPALRAAGFEVVVRSSRLSSATKVAASRFFPGVLGPRRVRGTSDGGG